MTNRKDNTASLTIKTDENNKAVPLGIKSTVEGIQNFSNWDNIANSIDEMSSGLRRADSFKNNKRVVFNQSRRTFVGEGASNMKTGGFDDIWDVNKIKIVDDLAFVGEDEYTDVEKLSSPNMTLEGYQYFVARTLERNVTIDEDPGGDEFVPGFATWDAEGAYTAHMPFTPGAGDAGPFNGTIVIKYIPGQSRWEVSASIPNDGGWGGDFSGSATYNACSGGGTTDVDVTITGSHLCTATSAVETYTGTVRLNVTPANSSDELTCTTSMTLNSITFGTPTQYSSPGGCYITRSESSLSFQGYTPPVDSRTSSNIKLEVGQPIGSYTVKVADGVKNILQDHAFVGDTINKEDENLQNPTLGDFSHLYIRVDGVKEVRVVDGLGEIGEGFTKKGNFFKFGGFVNNDFSKSNCWVLRDADNCFPKVQQGPNQNILADDVTLNEGLFRQMLGGGLRDGGANMCKCADQTIEDRDFGGLAGGKCKSSEGFNPPLEFTKEGLSIAYMFGGFLPPNENQLSNFLPCNYSVLKGSAVPEWPSIAPAEPISADTGQPVSRQAVNLHKQFLFSIGRINIQQLNDNDYFEVAGRAAFGSRGECDKPLPLNSIAGPYPKRANAGEFGIFGMQFKRNGLAETQGTNTRRGLDDPFAGTGLARFGQDSISGGRAESSLVPIPDEPADSSEIGFYYLVVDDSDPSNPFISAIQFDYTKLTNTISKDDGVNPYGSDEGLSDFQKGLRYQTSDITLQFIKLLPVRKCGKVDIYKRIQSAAFSYLGNGVFSFANHGLKDKDFVKITGALYKETGAAIRDKHPLNGTFRVKVLNSSTFRFLPGGSVYKGSVLNPSAEIKWDDPPSLADMEDLRSMFSVSIAGVGDNRLADVGGEIEGQGWAYQGSVFSPTGRNGYFNGLFNQQTESSAENRLATQDEFYKKTKIDTTDLRSVEYGVKSDPLQPYLWDQGYIDLSFIAGGPSSKADTGSWSGGCSRGWEYSYSGNDRGTSDIAKRFKDQAEFTTKSFALNITLEAIPETPKEMRICGSKSGWSATTAQDKLAENIYTDPAYQSSGDKDKFTGGRSINLAADSSTEIRNLSLGADQIYPYTGSEYYCGSKFGCDFKVVRNKGGQVWDGSKYITDFVYTLVVGERSSDVSVDIFGSSTLNANKATEAEMDSIKVFTGARKQIPEYLPYGKTHIIDITMGDDDEIIVEHKNSLFGGGHCIKKAQGMNENIVNVPEHSIQRNPWSDLEVNFRVDNGLDGFSRISRYTKDDILVSEQDFLDTVRYLRGRSRYWQRHAVMHWYPQPIPEILNFRDGLDAYPIGESLGRESESGDIIRSMFKKDSTTGKLRPAGGSFANPSETFNRTRAHNRGNHALRTEFGTIRRPMIDGTEFSQYVSIFGDDENIISIDRFDVTKKVTTDEFVGEFTGQIERPNAGYWDIFPWVDSFGKSVAISIDNSLADGLRGRFDYHTGQRMTILSGSTSRSNIDITEEVQQPIANLTKDQIKPGDRRYKKEDSESQIGQLNAHFLYGNFTNYEVVDYMEINSRGSIGGRYRTYTQYHGKSSEQYRLLGISFTKLPQGTYAGHGIAEVMTSCHMSYSDIVFEKDRIIFSEQSLGENKSIIHVFDFNASSLFPFRKNHTIERQFNFERNSEFTTDENKIFKATESINTTWASTGYRKVVDALALNVFNVGDGFGLNIRCYEDLLLTNATDTFDEFGQIIPVGNGNNPGPLYGMDQIFVYEKFRKSVNAKAAFEFSQKITPTTTEEFVFDDDYRNVRRTEGLDTTLGKRLSPVTVPVAAMNYDNVPNGTFAWNIRLAGRYDLANYRILLQDPYSVAIFDRDFSESEPMIGVPFARNPELTSAKIETFDHQDTSKLTYETVTGTRTRSGVAQNFYDCRLNIEDYQKSKGKYHELPEQVPILNYSLEGDEDIYLSEMTINFNLAGTMDDISTTFTPRIERPVTEPLVPRIVLYTRDPATIVKRNTSSKIIENASNISNFYTLDTSNRTKRVGGFISPSKSASDFDSPAIEGNTFFNDVRATHKHRDAGFMGQFRGGAQDLFFYGTLDGSTPENAQEVFGGSEPRATLPYLYGGQTNLADFTDGCSWIAPDVYHKYTTDQIARIKPYAKLFNPVKQSNGRYSITITSEDINFRDFINKGTGGIWIGFVLTNIMDFDIHTSQLTYEEFYGGNTRLFYPDMRVFSDPVQTYTAVRVGDITTPAPDGDIGPFRYILPASRGGLSDPEHNFGPFSKGFIKTVTQNWVNARYPYCRVGVFPAKSSGKGSQTQIRKIDRRLGNQARGSATKSLSCFAEATVKNPEIELKGFVTTGRRYKTSFSRKAIVSLKDIFTQPTYDHLSSSVVGISSSEVSKDGKFADSTISNSYQILTATDGYIQNPFEAKFSGSYDSLSSDFLGYRSEVFGGNEDPFRDTYDQPGFRHSNILSSFDIVKPDYVSLTIRGLPGEENIATLFTPTPSAPASGLASLVLAPAQDSAEKATTLFTGLRDFDGAEPLFLSNKVSENKFTLNINEIQPSAVVPFFAKTVDASGGIDLAFAPPTTGSAPLFVTGPVAASGFAPLNTVGGAFMDEVFTLRVSGAFQSSGNAPLFTNSHLDASGTVGLVFAPPKTGSIPLYLNSNPVASGQATLTIFDKASGVQDVNLFIGDQFDVINQDLSIFIDVPLIGTGQVPLQMEGFALTADSNRNSSSSFLVGLPDNEFDKGDPNGDFNEDPITKIISAQNVSSNSVLSNAVDEQFYEYNKNMISPTFRPRLETKSRSMSGLKTDPFSPYIFAGQRIGNNYYAPYANKTGTLDPAYNLAIGRTMSNLRKAKVFPLDGADSEAPPHNFVSAGVNVRDFIRKYFTYPDTYLKKEFYDINENVLVTGALKGSDDILEISIYDIDDDGNVSQRGKGGVDSVIRTSPVDMMLGEDGKPQQNIIVPGGRNNYGSRSQVLVELSFSEDNEPYAKNISPTLIDPFTSLREEIFKKLLESADSRNTSPPTGSITEAIFHGVQMDISSVKVSKNNKCAVSFRARATYDLYRHRLKTDANGRTVKGKGRRVKSKADAAVNYIIVFDINKYNGASGFSSEEDFKLIRVATSHTHDATDMSFDSQDNLYVNTPGSDGILAGSITVYKKSKDYSDKRPKNNIISDSATWSVAASFKDTEDQYGVNSGDYDAYKGRNIAFLKNQWYSGLNGNFTGFGHKVKIYEDYSSDGEIMIVSAPLFDPFIMRYNKGRSGGLSASTTGSHWLNPMGAVYIYKRAKDEDNFTYHSAVYAKGYTSGNIISNLGNFRGGTIGSAAGKPQVSLFGYDFDYSEDILSVTAPGGDGEGTVEAAKVYSFNIASDPVLTNTHSASDITFNSSSIKHGDNFGTHISRFDKNNIFVFSDTVLDSMNLMSENLSGSKLRVPYPQTVRNRGESLLHNLANGSSFGLSSRTSSDSGSLEYNRLNDFKELKPYFTSGLKSGAYPELSSVMQVWSRILSIKKFSTKNKDRLLVVRKFAFRLNSAEGMTEEDHYNNSFDVVKLQVIDLERSVNGTLFIKAPDSADSGSLAPLYSLAPGPSGNFDMVIKPIAYPSGLASLFVDNRSLAADIPLHIPRIDNVFLPLAASGFAPSVANEATLFMKHQIAVATPDLFMSAIGVENSGISFIAQGSLGEGVSADPSLVINRHVPGIPTASAATLFLNQTNFKTTSLFANNAGSDNPAIDLVVGSPLFASPTGSIPLSVKTFTPPVGPGGGFVGSGIISIAMSGNNDAGVYNKHNGDTSLVLAAKNITDSQNVLFIEKSFGGLSPLYMDSRIASGDVVLNVEGANIQESNINLNTRGGTALVGLAETGNFSAFTRGWFD